MRSRGLGDVYKRQGVISPTEREQIDLLINELVQEHYYKMLVAGGRFSLIQLQTILKKSIRKKVYKKTDKEPMVVIAFNEV